jgi:hypothetical protein
MLWSDGGFGRCSSSDARDRNREPGPVSADHRILSLFSGNLRLFAYITVAFFIYNSSESMSHHDSEDHG